jgi:hypothetical protein
VPPSFTSLFSGNTLTVEVNPPSITCSPITLNFLGYSSFTCSASQTGTYSFKVKNPQNGIANLLEKTIEVQDAVCALQLVMMAAAPSDQAS